MTVEEWLPLENPFVFKLQARKLMHGFFTDHAAKLEARRGSHPVVGELWDLTRPLWEDWQRDFSAWQLASGAHRAATRVVMSLRRELLTSPGGEGRSRLDEWAGALEGLFPRSSPEFVGLFPQGRMGIRLAGLDEIGEELVRVAGRLAAMQPGLVSARDGVLAEAQAYLTAGLPVPEGVQLRLEAAEWRVSAAPGIARRMDRFGRDFMQRRSEQQGLEGALTAAARRLAATHARVNWRLFANLSRLIDWAITTAEGPPQMTQAAAFFDLAMLPKRRTTRRKVT